MVLSIDSTLTPESEEATALFSCIVSILSFLFKGLLIFEFEDGGLGGRGLLIFPLMAKVFPATEGEASETVFRSDGGAFSFETLCFREDEDDLCFRQLGF